MFKRILSAVTGKQESSAVSAGPPHTNPTAETKDDLVTDYDAYGRQVKITRGEWRDKIYLPNLTKKWNEPGELYNLIVSGLGDGFAEALLPATEHLLEIDDNAERSHAVRSIVPPT